MEVLGKGELANCLAIAEWVLVLLLLAELDRSLVEDKFLLDVVLEAQNEVVPDCSEPRLVLLHHIDHTGVYMAIEVPTIDIGHVASLDRD